MSTVNTFIQIVNMKAVRNELVNSFVLLVIYNKWMVGWFPNAKHKVSLQILTSSRVTLTFSFVSPLRSQNDSNPVVEVAVGHLAGCLLDPKPLPETLTFWTMRKIAASALERFFRG